MDKMESLLKEWKEMTHSMEMELQAQNELIDALKGQSRCLKEQVALLEDEKKKLIDAGNNAPLRIVIIGRALPTLQKSIQELLLVDRIIQSP